jgi:hypothetical protein
MLNRALWTWLGCITLMVGILLVFLMLTGFHETVDCGTFGLNCMTYSILMLPTVAGISSVILWAGVPVRSANSKAKSFARILAIVITSVFALLMLVLIFLIIAIGGR